MRWGPRPCRSHSSRPTRAACSPACCPTRPRATPSTAGAATGTGLPPAGGPSLRATVADPLYFRPAAASRLRAGLHPRHFGPFALRLHRACIQGGKLALQAARCPDFRALQAQVGQLAGRARAPFGHLPSPHVTLSRHARGRPSPHLVSAIDWPIGALCLVWSQLRADVGHRHDEVLARYPARRMRRRQRNWSWVFAGAWPWAAVLWRCVPESPSRPRGKRGVVPGPASGDPGPRRAAQQAPG